jgi:3-methyladenine DNA glycosylase AlkC
LDAFKNQLGPAAVQALGAHLQRAWPAFDREGFERQALHGLEPLALKARAFHLADALQTHLGADFRTAAARVEAALAPPRPAAEGFAGLASSAQGLAGWVVWPLGEWVVRQGMDDPQRALACLHALTQRFSAEFAIRAFIARHPAQCLEAFQRWTVDPSEHVRRLVSEGSRPRLPWGAQLRELVRDPSPNLPLLAALQDDPSPYVRRSVANHLNDIAKDHPERIAQWLQTHLPACPPERRALLRHASRTLIKQGHPPTLAAWGLGQAFRGELRFAVTPDRLVTGEHIGLTVSLTAMPGAPAQTLEVDYAIHHVKANGGTQAKVFKGWRLQLAPGESRELRKRHPMRSVTVRTLYPGQHGVDLRLNGEVVAQAGFELLARAGP